SDNERLSLFRGWLYSAVNVLASEAAGQEAVVARLAGAAPRAPGAPRAARPPGRKAAGQEYEILLDHPVVDAIENPNPIQHRWQFVYTFVASLNLTGWAFVVGGRTEDDKFEMYALPTSWVR